MDAYKGIDIGTGELRGAAVRQLGYEGGYSLKDYSIPRRLPRQPNDGALRDCLR